MCPRAVIPVVCCWLFPHKPLLSPVPTSLLMAMGCYGNHKARSSPYDKLTLALTEKAFPLMHTGTLTYRITRFDREAQIQTSSDMYTFRSAHTHTLTLTEISPLPHYFTAQLRWASLRGAVSTRDSALIDLCPLQLWVHWHWFLCFFPKMFIFHLVLWTVCHKHAYIFPLIFTISSFSGSFIIPLQCFFLHIHETHHAYWKV